MSEAEMNGQLESVCESVFSEMEAQAMDALGLPGCFRTRSHSYLRAIQAGYAQDDDECVPAMPLPTATPAARPMAGKAPRPGSRACRTHSFLGRSVPFQMASSLCRI